MLGHEILMYAKNLMDGQLYLSHGMEIEKTYNKPLSKENPVRWEAFANIGFKPGMKEMNQQRRHDM